MTPSASPGYVLRFDHDQRRYVRAPVLHEVTARRAFYPGQRTVEIKMEAGGAQHFTWITAREARVLSSQLLAAATQLEEEERLR